MNLQYFSNINRNNEQIIFPSVILNVMFNFMDENYGSRT